MTSYFNKLSLLWQEMDLCKETIWNTPNDAIEYAKLEAANHIYNFLVGLNPKFDVVLVVYLNKDIFLPKLKCVLKSILKKICTNVMSVLTTLAIASSVFSARSSNPNNHKNNRKSIPICVYCTKQWYTNNQC